MPKGYIPIPDWICADPSLSPTAKLLFGCLTRLQAGKPFSFAKQETLATMIGVHRNSIRSAITQLTKRGLLRVTKFHQNKCTFNNYSVLKSPPPGYSEACTKTVHGPCTKTVHHTIREYTRAVQKHASSNRSATHATILATAVKIRAARERKNLPPPTPISA